MLAVLTEPNVNIRALLKTASTNVDTILANSPGLSGNRPFHLIDLNPAGPRGGRRPQPDRPPPGEPATTERQMADVLTLTKRQARHRRAQAPARGRARAEGAGGTPSAYGFLIGAVLCFTFFSWYPIVREIIMSFQKPVTAVATPGQASPTTCGSFHDPTFWQAWRNTLEFTLLALVIGYAVPFCVAILLNELRHARGYLRILVYLPVMLPPASALLLFAYFYNPQYGLFDESCAPCTCPPRSGSSSRAPASSAPRWSQW